MRQLLIEREGENNQHIVFDIINIDGDLKKLIEVYSICDEKDSQNTYLVVISSSAVSRLKGHLVLTFKGEEYFHSEWEKGEFEQYKNVVSQLKYHTMNNLIHTACLGSFLNSTINNVCSEYGAIKLRPESRRKLLSIKEFSEEIKKSPKEI